ncbi:MAG: hypothetical protein FJ284_13130, partial [Planctomycetes bacterium]|nr:hypothetical protein [Planctomycetota bacterium]
MTNRRRPTTAIPSASGVALLALAATLLVGSPGRTEPPPRELPWNLPALVATPRMEETDRCPARGMKALFYEGADSKGRPTKVFAYYAAPDGQPPAGGWPAVVCAHGGGGTAYPDWVSAWNARGYAAIAMDLEGHLPNRHEFGLEGPWPGGDGHHDAGPARCDWFGDRDLPDDAQWF